MTDKLVPGSIEWQRQVIKDEYVKPENEKVIKNRDMRPGLLLYLSIKNRI